MANCTKALAMLIVTAVAVAAFMVTADAQNELCVCPCMREQCMTISGATRDDCAAACDKGCDEAGFPKRSAPTDYCGF